MFSPQARHVGPRLLRGRCSTRPTREGCITLAFGVGADDQGRAPGQHRRRTTRVPAAGEARPSRTRRSPQPFVQHQREQQRLPGVGRRSCATRSTSGPRDQHRRLLGLNKHVSVRPLEVPAGRSARRRPHRRHGLGQLQRRRRPTDNDENMLIIRGDRRAADIYFTEFNRLFNHYYFRSVTEDTSRRRRTNSPTQAGASRFLQGTDAWTAKYTPGSFRSKHLALVASVADAQLLPVTGKVPAEPQPRRGLVAGSGTSGEVRSSRTAAFELYQDRGGKYRWRLRAANGEVVAQGQSYKTRAAAKKAVDAVRRSASFAIVPECPRRPGRRTGPRAPAAPRGCRARRPGRGRAPRSGRRRGPSRAGARW